MRIVNRMWLLVNNFSKSTVQKFRVKSLAQKEIDNREGLCQVLNVSPSKIYSIKKEVKNGTTKRRLGKERAMP